VLFGDGHVLGLAVIGYQLVQRVVVRHLSQQEGARV
jgi:hypothetical protein